MAGDPCVIDVELRVECRNLRNRDTFSKSDPCVVLLLHDGQNYVQVARTEMVKNDLDPCFVRPLPVQYHFEAVQKIRFDVYDIDNLTETLNDDDFLGCMECTLGQLVSGSPFTRPLLKMDGAKIEYSRIVVRAEEIKNSNQFVRLLFSARNLDNKDGFFGKSDPFLQVSGRTADGGVQVVWKTEVVNNNLSPQWQAFTLRLNTLCGSDYSRQIQFDIYDYDGDGSHDVIGSFDSSLQCMLKAHDGKLSWPVVNHTKLNKKKYTDSGTVFLHECSIYTEHSFLDFIFGGLQMNLSIAIDFTASNGHPLEPTSLHYVHPTHPNEYMQAIRAVGHVLQDYDSDKLFPVLGFGALLPTTNQVSFEFAVNFNNQNPFCAGIDGVLQAYQSCIRNVQLYGPTNVAPIIRHASRFAKQAQESEMAGKGSSAYFLLLLLTDGVITDVDATVDAIVEASFLPISLIIVGVGGADFALMNFLDADDGLLQSSLSGRRAQRDVVQFVPFRKFLKASVPAALTRHVLAEVPGQVTKYFKLRGLPPNVPQHLPPQ